MFDIRPLLQVSYWLDISPPLMDELMGQVIFWCFAIFLIVGAVIRVVGSKRKDDKFVIATFNKFGTLFLASGFLGLLFYFFSYEQIYLFGARFWFLVIGITFLVWLGYIIRYIKKTVPKEKAKIAEREKFEKYMPKKKK